MLGRQQDRQHESNSVQSRTEAGPCDRRISTDWLHVKTKDWTVEYKGNGTHINCGQLVPFTYSNFFNQAG